MDRHFEAAKLESLLESARLLNSLELDGLLKHLLRTVMGRLLVTKAVIAIERHGQLEAAFWRGLSGIEKGQRFGPEEARAAGLDQHYPFGDGLGLLATGPSLKGQIDPGEREFLEALLGLATSSIENARSHEQTVISNRSLDQKIQELRALLDLVRGLAATTDPDEIAQLLTLTLAGRWAVLKHAVLTWKPGQVPLEREKGIDLHHGDKLREAVTALTEAAFLESDLPADLREQVKLPSGSLLFPIRSNDLCHGVVVLGPRLGGKPYTEADREFGAGLVAQAAVAFDNAWHFRETLAKQQIEKELYLAASIQVDLFPKTLPTLDHTEIAARNRQARQVGGDYYDVLYCHGSEQPEHLLCVADISGKGIAAALLMSNIQATLRAILAHETDVRRIAVRTNDLLWASTPPNKYATAFLVRYDPATGAGQYVNGGHNDPVILRADGSVELLGTTGMPIGMFPKREFEQGDLQLHSGDILFIYSDGVPDANNLGGEEFDMERLVGALRESREWPVDRIIDHMFQRIDEFAGEAPQFDDITMMVVRRC
ncbi:MAG: PP2C family protein-serine/threonine phosphatase [Bryobacteraceae bacterium]|nr:PP2C family protein-serine/threonine phosphatase [Bryobacteraceae bacterium]